MSIRLPGTMKKLFVHQENWWRFYEKEKESMRPAIVDNVIKMLSCGLLVRGYAMYSCGNEGCVHQKKVPFSCKSRFCPTCGKKLTDQWIETQGTVLPDTRWQHITFTMPQQIWVLIQHNRHLLNPLSGIAAQSITTMAKKKDVLPGIFTALHTFGRDLKWNVHVHLSVTCGGLTNERTTWKTIYFAKDPIMKLWRYGIINLLREAYNSGELTFPEGICGANPTPTEFNNWLDEHYQKHWIIHFAKPGNNAQKNVKYPGRYLKRPALSMSRLKHYDGKEVVFDYLDHRDQQHKSMPCETESFIKRLVQHIPDKGFRMIRYYGFLANCLRSRLLPTVYNLLDQPERNALTLRWPALLQSSFGINPLTCILCGHRLSFRGVVTGKNMNGLRKLHEKLARGRPVMAV